MNIKAKGKNELIAAIEDLGYYKGYYARHYPLAKMNVEKLTELLSEHLAKKSEKDRIDAITFTADELHMEQYLADEYDVQQEDWLKDTTQIKQFIDDVGAEYLDCGQGYYQNEGELIIKIGSKFYKVNFTAYIESSKQDRGDRLYWVEHISDCSWVEIAKPQPKRKVMVSYEFNMSEDEHQRLVALLDENKFVYSQYSV